LAAEGDGDFAVAAGDGDFAVAAGDGDFAAAAGDGDFAAAAGDGDFAASGELRAAPAVTGPGRLPVGRGAGAPGVGVNRAFAGPEVCATLRRGGGANLPGAFVDPPVPVWLRLAGAAAAGGMLSLAPLGSISRISVHLRHFIRTTRAATFSSAIWYLALQLGQMNFIQSRHTRNCLTWFWQHSLPDVEALVTADSRGVL
jgi:hypothetical protein